MTELYSYDSSQITRIRYPQGESYTFYQIVPLRFYRGPWASEPYPVSLLEAYDVERKQKRTFMLGKIQEWDC